MVKSDKSYNLFSIFQKIISSLGEYLIEVGEAETNDPDFREFIKESKKNPEIIFKLMNKIPKDYREELLDLFFRMTLLSNRTSNLDELEPEDKIQLGKKLIDLSNEFNKLFNKINKEIIKRKKK